MYVIFESLNMDLVELKNQIDFIEQSKIEIPPTSRIYEYSISISKKKFEYNSIIISLYGIVENYLERFCFEYIELVETTIPNYSCLDAGFTESHFKLSLDLANKIIGKKHQKYLDLDKVAIIHNLNNCLTNDSNYKLNKEAFTINTGNCNHKKNCETISSMNINNFNAKMVKLNNFNPNSENAFNKIDDLVQRRNEVSHGNVSDFLGTTELIPFIDFIENYMLSIAVILQAEIIELNNLFLKKYRSTVIENHIYCSSQIIGIENGVDLELKIGGEILFVKGNGSLDVCNIIDLKELENKIITIKLNKKIKKNYMFYKLF